MLAGELLDRAQSWADQPEGLFDRMLVVSLSGM
jgi:hypothetical protein